MIRWDLQMRTVKPALRERPRYPGRTAPEYRYSLICAPEARIQHLDMRIGDWYRRDDIHLPKSSEVLYRSIRTFVSQIVHGIIVRWPDAQILAAGVSSYQVPRCVVDPVLEWDCG